MLVHQRGPSYHKHPVCSVCGLTSYLHSTPTSYDGPLPFCLPSALWLRGSAVCLCLSLRFWMEMGLGLLSLAEGEEPEFTERQDGLGQSCPFGPPPLSSFCLPGHTFTGQGHSHHKQNGPGSPHPD